MRDSSAAPVPTEVEVFDPEVRTTRDSIYRALAFFTVTLGFLGVCASHDTIPIDLAPALVVAIAEGAVASLLVQWFLRRRAARWRRATVIATPGALRIRSASKSYALRSRDIEGASTAAGANGELSWAIARKGESRPLLLRARTRPELEHLQAKLAFGQRDVNRLSWNAGVPAWATMLAGLLFFLLGASAPVVARFDSPGAASALLFAVTTVGLFASSLAARFLHPKRSIAFSPQGLHIRGATLPGAKSNELGVFVPYAQIAAVERVGSRLYLDTTAGFYAEATQRAEILDLQDDATLTQAELAHIAEQIETAVQRSRAVVRAGALDASLSAIERRGTTADWMAQLSTIEATRDQGYRGNDLDREALLRAAIDPDAAAPARFAAARLLRRDPDARARIEETLVTARFEPEERMLRVALEDDAGPARIDQVLDDVEKAQVLHRRGA